MNVNKQRCYVSHIGNIQRNTVTKHLPDNSSSKNAKIDSNSSISPHKEEKSDDLNLNAKSDVRSGTDASGSQKESEVLEKISNQKRESPSKIPDKGMYL